MKKIIPLVLIPFLGFASASALADSAPKYTPNHIAAVADKSPLLTIEHQSGSAKVAQKPSRVVLFDFGVYDTMNKLGLADNVVALPLGNLPSYLKGQVNSKVADAGGMKTPDLAKIAELKPDLIVITGRQGKSFDELNKIAPTVNLGTGGDDYLAAAEANIALIGQLYDIEKKTAEELTALNKTIAQAQEKAAKSGKKVLVMLHNDGKLFPNKQPVVYQVVKAAAVDIPVDPKADKDKRPLVTPDMVAELNPDVILVIDRSAAIGAGQWDKAAFETDGVKKTNAFKNDKIIVLQPDLWYLSGGGLDSLSRQVQAVESAL
ncbi:siderophore ABC transporter substrate-binding protein [Morganella morganii]|uniref:siderophore ABC transporter substrate-binding protein n=1 Tax=Morganella morganii TaxID=582 RepID=UPI001A29F099|nr:ABC transporter substrate-binding protein [Morganella morganii]MCU6212241.1 ABC transporter substrate-binding protein [Morganella morganii]MCU6224216.1 ABC transporter substrate-binding protein [Morganella morganii]MCU6233720.1 ABC transporter substrate-binding protein [Morganella morganii]MCU6236223.1 ABC transporter substrate-binding protein [Morganella morganii]MCU6274486.1 ABC transporter substrate-binding protein [Morganella morganii]